MERKPRLRRRRKGSANKQVEGFYKTNYGDICKPSYKIAFPLVQIYGRNLNKSMLVDT